MNTFYATLVVLNEPQRSVEKIIKQDLKQKIIEING
jgi:hypothetical protein